MGHTERMPCDGGDREEYQGLPVAKEAQKKAQSRHPLRAFEGSMALP